MQVLPVSFNCLASQAVHLEMAYGLDTDSFLRAFTRMSNRQGLPEEMLSDNGTNFVGANEELRKLTSDSKLKESLVHRKVKGIFNPPSAPHFGGVYETMIKAAKRAILAILDNADIADEELLTAYTEAESLLNLRPLTYQTANPEDDVPLAPNHFMVRLEECLHQTWIRKKVITRRKDGEEFKNWLDIFSGNGRLNGYRV